MCCFVELKKASKRMTCHKRYKIQKKVSLGRVVKLKLKLSNLKLLSRARGQGLYTPWNSPGQNTGVVAFPFSRRSSQPRDQTQVSRITGGFFTS